MQFQVRKGKGGWAICGARKRHDKHTARPRWSGLASVPLTALFLPRPHHRSGTEGTDRDLHGLQDLWVTQPPPVRTEFALAGPSPDSVEARVSRVGGA